MFTGDGEELSFIDQTPRMGSFEEAGETGLAQRPNLQLLTVTPSLCNIPNRRKSRPLQHSVAIAKQGVSCFNKRTSLSAEAHSHSYSNSGHSSLSSMIEQQDYCNCSGVENNVELHEIAAENAFKRQNPANCDDANCMQLDIDVPLRSAVQSAAPARSRRSASVRSTSAQSGEFAQLLCKSTQTDNHSIGLHSFRGSSQQSTATATVTRYNAQVVADIGTEVLRQTGAYPGFKQLQKINWHSQSNSNLLNQNALNDTGSVALVTATLSQDDTVSFRASALPVSRHPSRNSVALLDRDDCAVKCTIVNDTSVFALATSTTTTTNQLIDPSTEMNNNNSKSPMGSSRANQQIELRQPEIGYRLGRRKKLYETRRRIADYTLLCAIFGIVVAVVEMEATLTSASSVYKKNGLVSLIVKSIITVSTLVLLALEISYHVVEIRLFCIDNCIEDWRVAIDSKRVLLTSCKLLVCSVHPFPGAPNFAWAMVDLRGVSMSPEVSLDVVLTLPMFLRLYLIFRVMLLHSKLFTDASSRSIGAMNRIKFNIRFVLKTLMTLCPGTVLLVLILSLLIVASWSIRVCEGQHKSAYLNLLNSLWFISITFMSIGYGDIVPESICGRLIAVFTGMMGSGCMALVVAVVARKLELTRAEKHVHNFMMDNQLTKSLRSSAANVLRETWLIYKYTKLAKRINPYKVRYHQRKFFDAIQALRKVKLDQRKLADHTARLVDLPKLHHQLHDSVMEAYTGQQQLKEQVQRMAERMSVLEAVITDMPHAIANQLATVIHEQLRGPLSAHATSQTADGDGSLRPVMWRTSKGSSGAEATADQGVADSHNSLNLHLDGDKSSFAAPLADQSAAPKSNKLDGCDRMSRQSSSVSQPARRTLKLAEMPDTFKSHSAV